MELLKILLFVFALLVIVGAVLPSKSHVERSVVIAAPAEQVFDYLNTYQNFNTWSPWHRIDPDTQSRYFGPESGLGAKMAWESDNDKIGSGSQEIIESLPHQLIRVALDFHHRLSFACRALCGWDRCDLYPLGPARRCLWMGCGQHIGLAFLCDSPGRVFRCDGSLHVWLVGDPIARQPPKSHGLSRRQRLSRL